MMMVVCMCFFYHWCKSKAKILDLEISRLKF